MFELISISGPFGVVSIAVAATGLALALAEVATRGDRSFRRGVGLAATVALLLGVAGTGTGLYIASQAVIHAPDSFGPDQLTVMWRAGFGVAVTTTAIGCLGAVADLLALGVLFGLEGRRSAAV